VGRRVSPWTYEGEFFTDPQNAWGFVYEIIDLTNNKRYIGKKQFLFKKTKTVKGKRKRTLVESDWQTYFGSSDTLKEQITLKGFDNFERRILRICYSKSECSYWEAKYQFEYDVLLNPNDFYNEWISCKVSRRHLVKK
jgi:Putative endonuclease segE, GIY-YIG domain